MVDQLPQLVLFDGPQGCGKTSAAQSLGELGYTVTRGIPKVETLVNNSPQEIWDESVNILQTAIQSNRQVAFDRTLWSLVAYHLSRDKALANALFLSGVSQFVRLLDGVNYSFFMLDSDPIECYLRNADDSSPVTLTSIQAYETEVHSYRTLTNWIKKSNIPILTIRNSGPRHTFLGDIHARIKGTSEPCGQSLSTIAGIRRPSSPLD